MRILRPLVALLAALFVAAATLAYLHESTRGDRIYLQGRRSSPAHHLFTASSVPDPYHQRYYSQSEGWTYYDLPSYSSAP